MVEQSLSIIHRRKMDEKTGAVRDISNQTKGQ